MKNTDYKTELGRIKTFIDGHAGYDISTRSRKAEAVMFRTLYFKLAMESTFWSLQKVGDMVGRNHATAIHSRSMFDEIMQNKQIKKLYYAYKVDILGQAVTDNYKDAEQYNELKRKYNDLLFSQKTTYVDLREQSGIELTENEKAYRKLSDERKEDYDRRASLVLKSYNWKEYNTTFEIINCGGVTDARATLR